jgi:hypothetical protein|nr:MAG TPA: hypothetical protein [Caudoviricetes sp.]
MLEEKNNVIEQTALKFSELENDNKTFILGYMLGVMKEREERKQRQAVYSQGVLAMANMQKKEKAGTEPKYQQMSLF